MALDSKIREIVNVGVAVGINCQSCLDFHVKKARELGATNEELADAVRASLDAIAAGGRERQTWLNCVTE